MKKIIKLTESDILKIVNKVINEQVNTSDTLGSQMNYFDRDKIFGFGKENINPKNLKLGDGGSKNPRQIEDVKTLQQKLIDLGYLKTDTGKPTGYFGNLTNKALQRYNSGEKPETPTSKDTGKKIKPIEKGLPPIKSKAAKNAAKCETGTEQVLTPGASLYFDGDTLSWLVDGKAIKSWDATSGLTWKNTPPSDWGKLLNRYTQNKQEWSKQKNAGPLPEGKYSVGPLETRSGQPEEIGPLEAFWYKLTGQVEDETSANKQFCSKTILSRISWGNYRLRITPTGGQKMYNRSDFYIHGGSLAGSHGCIDLTDEMEDFAKFFGVWASANKKKTIPMVVKYKNSAINQVIQKLVNLF